MERALRFDAAYQRRVIDNELDSLFPQLAAILIDGPKGVGKTATASRRCATIRHLDIAAEARIVEADPRIVATDVRPILLDEWQRVPEIFDVVRRLVDNDGAGSQFILTGSAPTRQTHSGAGRITTMRMRPLTLTERIIDPPTVSLRSLLGGDRTVGGRTTFSLVEYVDEMLAGGFPGLRHLSGPALRRQLDSYLQRIVDHDLAEAGLIVRRPATVMAWLRGYAAASGTSASWEKIRDAATGGVADKPAKTTTLPYIELLSALRILDPVEAWTPSRNHLRALTQQSKHYLADPSLAARLLNQTGDQLVRTVGPETVVPRDGALLGGLFEGLAALSVRVFAQGADASVHHLRTEGGRHEVDFIVETEAGVLGIEAKLSTTISDEDVKHLRWLSEQIGENCIDLIVLSTGPEAYRRPDGVAVVPLALFGP
jgi:uncharacterized protein